MISIDRAGYIAINLPVRPQKLFLINCVLIIFQAAVLFRKVHDMDPHRQEGGCVSVHAAELVIIIMYLTSDIVGIVSKIKKVDNEEEKLYLMTEYN